MKLTKKHLFLLSFALLFLAVLVYTLFPKTTVASILHLDKKEQIVKVELCSPGEIRYWRDQRWLDITDTPLFNRYVDALFSTPTVARDDYWNQIGGPDPSTTVTSVRITLDNLPNDYPFRARTQIINVGIPTMDGTGNTTYLALNYTLEEEMRLQEKLNAQGKQELAPTYEYWEFDLSHNELFTVDFIQKQFE